jgi:ABC-type Fe3+-hydroxamate transport system substrate-binding protein
MLKCWGFLLFLIALYIKKPTNNKMRIVSLVPSLTELLVSLGLEDKIVGVTKFCLHPNHLIKTKKIIGGTKNINVQVIKELTPTLVIANKEENVKEQVQQLLDATIPVLVTEIKDLVSALQAITTIGEITGTGEKAKQLAKNISADFDELKAQSKTIITCAYLIWQKPFMVAGVGTFIHAMLEVAGFKNVFGSTERYPEVTMAQIEEKKPEVIFLSSEPYPFNEKHLVSFKEKMPFVHCQLADGEMFSWYGSRMQHFPAYALQLRQNVLLQIK